MCSLKKIFSKDILSHIFEYDNTYKEIFNKIIFGKEIKIKLFNIYKKQLFSCEKFNQNTDFKDKLEFILDYYFNLCIDYEFPKNIEIYNGAECFFYTNKKEHLHGAENIYYNNLTANLLNQISVSFIYYEKTISGEIENKHRCIIAKVFTDKEYEYYYNHNCIYYYSRISSYYNNGKHYLV